MVTKTKEGKIVYRASHANCIPFPLSGDAPLMAGIPRNFEIFDPLDFLAEVTQHIPNKGEHQLRYYGWYSNKQRGERNKKAINGDLPETQIIKKRCSLTWAMLIKMIFEVSPLICPKCSGEMKIISFIEKKQVYVIEKILKHCNLWKEEKQRPPPKKVIVDDDFPQIEGELHYDPTFFDYICS